MKRNHGWWTFMGKTFDVRRGVPLIVLSVLGDETSGVWVPRALESLNPLKLWAYAGPSSPTIEPQTSSFSERREPDGSEQRCLSTPVSRAVSRGYWQRVALTRAPADGISCCFTKAWGPGHFRFQGQVHRALQSSHPVPVLLLNVYLFGCAGP